MYDSVVNAAPDQMRIDKALDLRRDALLLASHPLAVGKEKLELRLRSAGQSVVAQLMAEPGAPNFRHAAPVNDEFRKAAQLLAFSEAAQPGGILTDLRVLNRNNADLIPVDPDDHGPFKGRQDLLQMKKSCEDALAHADSVQKANTDALRDIVLSSRTACLARGSKRCRPSSGQHRAGSPVGAAGR